MARRRRVRSISVPIVLASIAVGLAAALLVGWLILLGREIARSEDMTGNVWLLVLGAIAFVLIMVVLVLFTVSLARGILEVRKQDSFIDSVTHELKSPLASLQLCLETLGREGIESAQREQLHRMMRDDVDRLRSFIDDVLQANRLSFTRAGLLNLSDVSLVALVKECVDVVRVRHKLEEGEVSVLVEPGLSVTTDRAALEIVVKNLIDNAAKYSSRPARIEVLAHRGPKDRLLIEVRDDGIGIDRKNLKRIFHRFYRVEDHEVRERKGTGLGLFVVSALVRQLGGKVEALSEGKGRGTTMRVWLPLTPVTA
jgi:two-component system, OmpR family, sensor histidine kinase SenX3